MVPQRIAMPDHPFRPMAIATHFRAMIGLPTFMARILFCIAAYSGAGEAAKHRAFMAQ